MLVLTRNIGQTIVINENISIMIIGITGCQVRLGIEAPKDVTINREEIHKRIIQGIPQIPKSNDGIPVITKHARKKVTKFLPKPTQGANSHAKLYNDQ